MIVYFKKLHSDAIAPSKSHTSDAGFDLTALDSGTWDETYTYLEYRTGIAVEIPAGHVGLIFMRSSISKVNQILSNAVGVIDSGYRGGIKFRFSDTEGWGNQLNRYEKGDRIGQLIILPIPHIEMVESDNLSESDRGNGGFGSTGK